MSKHGTAGLHFLAPSTTANGLKYVELLQENLNLQMVVHNISIFMHDGASCHRSKVVLEYLSKSKVEVLDWSGNTPDLNPNKNLWSYMNKVAEKQPSSAKKFVTAIKEDWVKEISPEYCASLVKSMPSHLAAVVREKGGHIKY